MVVALLAFLKKFRHGCCLSDTFKIKSPDMVVVLLEFLSNMTHVLLASSYVIKRITKNNTHIGGKTAPLTKISQNDQN